VPAALALAKSAPRRPAEPEYLVWRRPYQRPNVVGFKRGRRQCFLDGDLPAKPTAFAQRPVISAETLDLLAQPGVVRVAVRPRGRTRLVGPADLCGADLYDLEEITRPTTWQAQKNFTGKVAIAHPRGDFHGWYWSDLEYDHYLELAWEGYDEFNTQFLRIYWHWPDGTVEFHDVDAGVVRDGQLTLVDITARVYLTPEKRRLFTLTSLTALVHGWEYEVGTDGGLPEVRRANLAFIEMASEHPPVERIAGTPMTFTGLVNAYGGGRTGRTRALRALWQRDFFIDMNSELRPSSWLSSRPRSARRVWRAR